MISFHSDPEIAELIETSQHLQTLGRLQALHDYFVKQNGIGSEGAIAMSNQMVQVARTASQFGDLEGLPQKYLVLGLVTLAQGEAARGNSVQVREVLNEALTVAQTDLTFDEVVYVHLAAGRTALTLREPFRARNAFINALKELRKNIFIGAPLQLHYKAAVEGLQETINKHPNVLKTPKAVAAGGHVIAGDAYRIEGNFDKVDAGACCYIKVGACCTVHAGPGSTVLGGASCKLVAGFASYIAGGAGCKLVSNDCVQSGGACCEFHGDRNVIAWAGASCRILGHDNEVGRYGASCVFLYHNKKMPAALAEAVEDKYRKVRGY